MECSLSICIIHAPLGLAGLLGAIYEVINAIMSSNSSFPRVTTHKYNFYIINMLGNVDIFIVKVMPRPKCSLPVALWLRGIGG